VLEFPICPHLCMTLESVAEVHPSIGCFWHDHFWAVFWGVRMGWGGVLMLRCGTSRHYQQIQTRSDAKEDSSKKMEDRLRGEDRSAADTVAELFQQWENRSCTDHGQVAWLKLQSQLLYICHKFPAPKHMLEATAPQRVKHHRGRRS
jgi:hypothetical protein